MTSIQHLVDRFLGSGLGRLSIQFGKFGMVGVVGLIVDMAAVSVCIRLLGIDFYVSRLISYLCAASTTWALNRTFTFRGASRRGALRQWATFLGTNAVGGIVNYAVYAMLVATTTFFATWPEAATAVGSLAGMLLNFVASKKYVFKVS